MGRTKKQPVLKEGDAEEKRNYGKEEENNG